jgi:hypothetical protein
MMGPTDAERARRIEQDERLRIRAIEQDERARMKARGELDNEDGP